MISARHDPALAQVFQRGSCYPDGLPLIWALRGVDPNAGWSKAARVRGPDLFPHVLAASQDLRGVSHYLLGGTEDVLEQLQKAIAVNFPGAVVAGAASPPFRPVHDVDWQGHLQDIRASGATHVWVGLGTPKQDFVAELLSDADPYRLYLAVGAAFDFVAGTTKIAPKWMQDNGLEWLFRLATEPRRLWRRYLIGNVKFIWIVAAQRCGMRTRQRNSK
ncbi:hypothetical protein GCM10009844_05380 [Nocardioides koreensis]|uniref:Glycosyltransferase n=1 Tax=Nocardioides koreensis TaxID=433651 RepID=A0ABN2Z793_9ACTN